MVVAKVLFILWTRLFDGNRLLRPWKLGSRLASAIYIITKKIAYILKAGSYTNYSLLWILLSSFTTAFLLQIMCVKLGNVTGKHLAELCRSYPYQIFVIIVIELLEKTMTGDCQCFCGYLLRFLS